ncbi:MAG: MurR/RpiR family transcriptional regulator, partial [Bacilli bacterium]
SLETFATETSVYLSETVDRNDDGMLADVIPCIARSTNLYVYANGPALSCASLLAFRLHRYGIHVHVINETGHALHERLLHVKSDDVCLMFLLSNVHPEHYVFSQVAKQQQLAFITITDLFVLPAFVDEKLLLQVVRGEIHAFHSMVAPMMLIESLIVGVGNKLETQTKENLERLENMRTTFESYVPRKLSDHV